MSDQGSVEKRFSDLGALFSTGASELRSRLRAVRALVFDWDGVFNAGTKVGTGGSGFSEADSMGTNLLRYALWRRDGRLPGTAVITGEDNPAARAFAEREHFDAVYYGVKDKTRAFEHFCAERALTGADVLCVVDDVNDLGMAARCVIRVLIRRDASALLQEYVVRHGLIDYVSAMTPDRCAVREVSELMLGLLGAYEAVLASRIAFDSDYAGYFRARQAVDTQLHDASPLLPE
jgi:3-deoxy-D-manno-octulosonate 8-phosphate phosphatase (KDO 8-P phosphatase)